MVFTWHFLPIDNICNIGYNQVSKHIITRIGYFVKAEHYKENRP